MTIKNASGETGTVRVSIAMVTYNSSLDLLYKTLDSLCRALRYARARGLGVNVQLLVADNSTSPVYWLRVRNLIDSYAHKFDSVELWSSGANIGYGAAHNQALDRSGSQYHLILNPDVEMDEDALLTGLRYIQSHSDVALVSPNVRDPQGQVQYLCKRYPSILVLSLRAWAPRFLRERFRSYLYSYEIRDNRGSDTLADVPLVSGCCICARTSALRRVSGFSRGFFMYFEDFDLSLRLHSIGRLVYLPAMRIVHHGGSSSRKGVRHVSMFVHSAWKFFRRHGWRWI